MTCEKKINAGDCLFIVVIVAVVVIVVVIIVAYLRCLRSGL